MPKSNKHEFVEYEIRRRLGITGYRIPLSQAACSIAPSPPNENPPDNIPARTQPAATRETPATARMPNARTSPIRQNLLPRLQTE